MGRSIIVSNRLPITVHRAEGELRLDPSSGGLATGLSAPHERGEGRWIGWPGSLEELSEEERRAVGRELAARRLVPVELSADEVRRYYESYSNGVLWPLLHYMTWQLPLEVRDFEVYEAVNQRFADAVASVWRPGDDVWVHDYQLMLVPELLRRSLPDARIGFFLHVPFPSSESVRALPERERILRGVLGADLVGFHTASYCRHFASSVLRILGIPTAVDRLAVGEREVRLGAFPMGVAAEEFAALAGRPAVLEAARELRGQGETRLLVGIDRLDYTKGIPRRLLAFERLLEKHPELHGQVRLVQVAVPSREDVGAYQDFRSQVDELIGRIHGRFATPQWVPVHWIYRGLSREEVVTLYCAADVMVVTPLRDGMNLVAKEFVASRVDEDGVLLLSEFAGAAAELADVVSVNPYDVDAVADAYYAALSLPAAERRDRMRALRRRVLDYDVHRWVAEFVAALGAAGAHAPLAPMTPSVELRSLAEELASAELVLLIDYDGTLVPFAETPERAAPDRALLDLLARLARRERTEVHVVSGRAPAVLERWLGDLPIALHAEHGLWTRGSPSDDWTARELPDSSWQESVGRILEEFASRTPGALVERKTASLAWHYRGADPDFGSRQAKELQIHLSEVLTNLPVEILAGSCVIEVRPHGIHKGRVVSDVLADLPDSTRIVALGDDRTDEDLFRALPAGAFAIHVGVGPSVAAWRVADVAAARRFLGWLLVDRAGTP